MKKTALILSVAAVIFSCKNETKPTIVGQNEQGQDLVVNAKGDTVVYTPQDTEKTKEEVKPVAKSAFEKNAEGLYTFRYNLEKGKTYPFSISTKSTTDQSDGKQSQHMSQESITGVDYTVKEIKDSTYLFEVKFTQFKEAMSNGKENISFDTQAEKPTKKEAQQQWEFNKAMVGKPFEMEITKEGKVVDVTKLLRVRNAIKEELGKSLTEEEKAGLDQVLSQSLSVEAMQSMFEESTSYYPKKAVKLDETWTEKEGNKKASSEMNYTFKGIADNMATVAISGKSNGNDSQSNKQGVKMFRSLEGTVTGTVKIDATTGWISNADIQKKEVVRVTQQYKNQKMNFSSTTKATTKIN